MIRQLNVGFAELDGREFRSRYWLGISPIQDLARNYRLLGPFHSMADICRCIEFKSELEKSYEKVVDVICRCCGLICRDRVCDGARC
jgi:hypothetical protein